MNCATCRHDKHLHTDEGCSALMNTFTGECGCSGFVYELDDPGPYNLVFEEVLPLPAEDSNRFKVAYTNYGFRFWGDEAELVVQSCSMQGGDTSILVTLAEPDSLIRWLAATVPTAEETNAIRRLVLSITKHWRRPIVTQKPKTRGK